MEGEREMAKIKITSNPYLKVVSFHLWQDEEACWHEINRIDNGSSSLLKEKYVKGFFPFKAKEIIDFIIDDYQINDEKIP